VLPTLFRKGIIPNLVVCSRCSQLVSAGLDLNIKPALKLGTAIRGWGRKNGWGWRSGRRNQRWRHRRERWNIAVSASTVGAVTPPVTDTVARTVPAVFADTVTDVVHLLVSTSFKAVVETHTSIAKRWWGRVWKRRGRGWIRGRTRWSGLHVDHDVLVKREVGIRRCGRKAGLALVCKTQKVCARFF
jgi:hypothetical protein